MNLSIKSPKVTVIVPFHNRISLLIESVKSVQAQTFTNWELLLVNDGSTDSLSEIEPIISNDHRITILNSAHQGAAVSRNLGIREAKGKYIAFLDSDDLWAKRKLELQVSKMEKNNLSVSHTSYQRMKEDGTLSEIIHSASQRGKLYPDLISNCAIATSTAMVRSDVIKSFPTPFPCDFQIGEDICLWIDLSFKYEFGSIDTPLSFVRMPKLNASLDENKQYIRLNNILYYVILSREYRYEAFQITRLWTLIQEANKSKSPSNDINLALNPLVSIVIPVYNGANYLREAINSALEQTYKNVEVIVVNDGSSDNGETERIALEYGDKIRYFYKENGGVATALNMGIQEMRGEYFSWLSHDDMYTREKIEREIDEVRKSGEKTTIVFGGYQVVNAIGEKIGEVNLRRYYSETQLSKPLFALLHGGIHGCALLIHKSHFQRVGLFDSNLPSTQDYDLWFRMFRFQRVYYYDGENVLSRWHDEQGSKKMPNHIKDACSLWINMMQRTSEAEQIDLAGSSYEFFRELESFLKTSTNYYAAITYAANMAKQQFSSLSLSAVISYKWKYFCDINRKVIYTYKQEGIRALIHKLIKRCRN